MWTRRAARTRCRSSSLFARSLFHVLEALLEQVDDVRIVETVVDHPPGAARPHESHAAQKAELVRHGRFAEPEEGGDVAHAQLRARQRVEDADAGRVAENLEGLGERR